MSEMSKNAWLYLKGVFCGRQDLKTKEGKTFSRIGVQLDQFTIIPVGISSDLKIDHKQGDFVSIPVRDNVYQGKISYFYDNSQF